MKIVSFTQPVLLQTKVGDQEPTVFAVNPGERYILNDDASNQIMLAKDNKIESISDFDPFYKANVQRPVRFRDKRVLFYRNRGIGDQLVASCLSRFFTEVLKAKCFQLSDRCHEGIWVGNPYISGMPVRFPLSIDSLIRFKGRQFYDYFFPMESVAEWNSEPEQLNFYDSMFAIAGFNPSEIPDKYKCPAWGIVPEDIQAFDEWKKQLNVPDKYIAFQLRATNLGRTPPPIAIDIILCRLNDLGIPILCMDDRPLTEEIIDIGRKHNNAKNVAMTVPGVRLYGTIISHAAMVVAPDSSGIHFAATNSVPCIGLWGPFSPESRAKYYPNHYPIYHPELCQNAPCFNFMPEFPEHKCPNGALQIHCEVFNGITYDVVDKIVTDVVKNHKIV